MNKKKGNKMRNNDRIYGPIAATKLSLMGIRFVNADDDNDGGDDSTDDSETNTEEKEENNTPDSTVYEAKISDLTGEIANRDAEIVRIQAELDKQKLANYDLLMATAGTEDVADNKNDDDEAIRSVDDLFTK